MPASLNKSRVGGHFDPTRLPAARAFFEAEGVIRPGDRPDSRGNIKGDCIAHPSKSHKSCAYRLNGQIYCYGCGFHGDLIDFVKLRRRVDFRTAAKILGAWRDSPLTQQERAKLNHRASVQQQEREQLTVLADYALGIQTALNFEGVSPFVYPGIQAYDALTEIELSLQELEKGGLQ